MVNLTIPSKTSIVSIVNATQQPGGLSVRPDGSLYATPVSATGFWSVLDAGEGRIFLLSPYNTCLGSRADGSVYTTPNKDSWERWQIEAQPNGLALLTSSQFGLHLGLTPDGRFYVSAQYFGVAQAFLKQKQYSMGRHKVVK